MPKIKSGKRENVSIIAHHPLPILPALTSETTTTMTTTTTSIFTVTPEQQATIDQTVSISQETMSEHDLKMLRDPPQLNFHSNEFMPSSLTQHPMSMPEDLSMYYDTLAASLSSLSSSNEFSSDYNNFANGLVITSTTNNDLQDFTFETLTPSISPNYAISEDAG
ncbi:357_t:CDS:2 [Ambispora leptoticha]|uniref:357_t:CDS:1 n=1 Tax=Ambispora leptoticha TaxID=144679 RepID=A0A9N8ZQC1_9GLOM|nr:357_t:CDS:2 [Ambispora leptoticha]